eukprot:scaffold14558_cov137-Cylindrotheca_fusiformis.AAC.12
MMHDIHYNNEEESTKGIVSVKMISPAKKNLHVTTRRSKSQSTENNNKNMTPEAKRQRIAVVQDVKAMKHPTKVPRPSKCVIAPLFEVAMNNKKREESAAALSDQQYLAPAGILSFEQVLLPAIAMEEEKALKKVQAIVQRDAPEYRRVVEQSRLLVRQSVMAAMQAVAESRAKRCQHQQALREQRIHEQQVEQEARQIAKQQERERKREEQRKLKEAQAAETKRRMQRQYPKNQKLWTEVMLLTSSITQLEKEERIWIRAEQGFIQSQETNTTEPEPTTEEPTPNVVTATKDELQEETENSIKDITLAATRIQQGLRVVQDIVHESDQVRKKLYQTYKTEHQFQGYPGQSNPAGLIRFLSQD